MILRLLAVFSLLFASSAFAQEDSCGGKNMLDALKAKDPKAHAEVLAEAAATPNGEAIFWKIEAPGGTKPSWLIGTIHITDPRVHALKPEVMEAIVNADVAAFELAEIVDQQRLALAMMKSARLMAMPAGKTLWDVIPDADEKAIREHPSLLPGQEKTLFAYQPWVVATLLSVPACESQRKLGGGLTLDEVLGRAAVDSGVTVVGLETIEEQLKLFADLSMEDQAKFLVSTAKFGAMVPDYFETMVQFYLSRQIAVLLPLTKRLQPANDPFSLEVMRLVEQDMLVKRNHRMAANARPLIDQGSAFVAVGALHLPGKEGVVQLLKDAGYKLTPVN